jgi:hypothetical protein
MNNKLLAIGAAAIFLSGCISVKSYVDPGFGPATYSELRAPLQKHQVRVDVEFQRNGEPFPRASGELRSHVERTLLASGVVQPEVSGVDTVIKVVVNNVADMGDAVAKGFGTGLTFGAAGSTVVDGYEIKISLIADGQQVDTAYEHALHSTVGNSAPPFQGVEGTTPADAFGKIVEEAVIKFIKDMQARDLLTFLGMPVSRS